LVVVLQAKRVVAISTVGWSPARLDVSGAPWFRTNGPQECRRVERARAHFHVIWLRYDAALPRPILLQCQDQILEVAAGGGIFLDHQCFRARNEAPQYNACRCHGCSFHESPSLTASECPQ